MPHRWQEEELLLRRRLELRPFVMRFRGHRKTTEEEEEKRNQGNACPFGDWTVLLRKQGQFPTTTILETNNKNIVPPCLRHYFNNNYEVNLLTNHEVSFFFYLKIFIWKRDMSSPTRQRESNETL